jgi:GDP-mannose 6-dehydrogenase
MNVSIFGLGYVGTVSAACLTELGHRIVGVDKSAVKIDLIRNGKSPVIEPHLNEMVKTAACSGLLTATTDAAEAINATDLSIICVGTPAAANGGLDLTAVEQVATDIGLGLRDKSAPHTIVVRSTVLPGTTRQIIVPRIAAASGKAHGEGFEVVFNPEFLREGCAIADFKNPSKTVVGAFNPKSAALVMSLYQDLPGAKVTPPVETAELVKYIDNAWHALKVTFANEVGVLAKALGIDGRDVMEIFIKDTRLNISPAYLRPGFAFGGSCLQKDLQALTHLTKSNGLSIPLLESILPSNGMIMDRGVDWILSHSGRRVAFLGISFKAATDDVRESPYVELARQLLGKGREIRIFDPNVKLSNLIGANREFLMRDPNLIEFLEEDSSEVMRWADVIVVTTSDPRFPALLQSARTDQVILDLSGVAMSKESEIPVRGFLW